MGMAWKVSRRSWVIVLSLGAWLAVTSMALPASGTTAGPNNEPSSWSIITPIGQSNLGSTGPIACPAKNWCLSLATNSEWNGTSWRAAPQPVQPFAGGSLSLQGLACPSATSCFAVGYGEPADKVIKGKSFTQLTQPVAEHFDGRRWTNEVLPTATDKSLSLTAIGCASRDLCFAMGYASPYVRAVDCRACLGGPLRAPPPRPLLLMRWNGTTWRSVAIRSTPRHDYNVTGLSCASPRLCVAVGTSNPDNRGGGWAPFLAEWNGSHWTDGVPSAFTQETPPFVSPKLDEGLSDVTCRPPRFCAVSGWIGGRHPSDEGGYYGNVPTYPLIVVMEHGRWQSPQVNFPLSGQLATALSIACPSPNDCVEAGNWGLTDHALIETWNGHSLTFVSTPSNPYAFTSELASVACPSVRLCFADGAYNSPSINGEAIIEAGPASTAGQRGPARVPVPNVVGTSKSAAWLVLTRAGFEPNLSANDYCAGDDETNATITSEDPHPGTNLVAGSTVTIDPC